jgi:hypothetical protein
VSRFLANLARRGAGLAAQIVPRGASIPPWPPAAMPLGTTPEPAIDVGTASADGPRITRDFFPAPRAPAALAPPSSSSRGAGDATGHDISRLDDPTPRSGAPSAPPPSEGLLAVERATIRPVPAEARACKAPEADANGTPEATPRCPTVPETPLRPPTRAVAAAPRPEPNAIAPSRQPIMEMPQAKSESAASPTPTTRPAATAEPPRVHVRIGKVEVRANTPAAAPARVARPKGSRGFSELRLARAHLDRIYR